MSIHNWIDALFDLIERPFRRAIEARMASEETKYDELAAQSRALEAQMWEKYPRGMRRAAERIGAPIPEEYQKVRKRKRMRPKGEAAQHSGTPRSGRSNPAQPTDRTSTNTEDAGIESYEKTLTKLREDTGAVSLETGSRAAKRVSKKLKEIAEFHARLEEELNSGE